MRIVLPVHQAATRGVGTMVRGLVSSIPAALGPDDDFVIVGRRLQHPEQLHLQNGSRFREYSERLNRLGYEQVYLPVAARNADLVHLSDSRYPLLSNQRFLLTVHDVFFSDHPEWFPATTVRYRQAMLAAALRKRPAAVVCTSHYTRDRLFEHYSRADRLDVVVIHPGVEPAAAAPDVAKETESEPYFLSVAVIEPRKNHLGLLHAYRAARQRGLELRWKVVGAVGQCADDIVAALQAEPGVDVLGHVSAVELERLYRGATFLAMPSHAEGFGFPPLEAMARGIPTICSTGSALDETVGDASLRVPADDREGWAEALRLLATDEAEQRRLRELGARRAAGFRLEDAASEYVAVYRAALADRPDAHSSTRDEDGF